MYQHDDAAVSAFQDNNVRTSTSLQARRMDPSPPKARMVITSPLVARRHGLSRRLQASGGDPGQVHRRAQALLALRVSRGPSRSESESCALDPRAKGVRRSRGTLHGLPRSVVSIARVHALASNGRAGRAGDVYLHACVCAIRFSIIRPR